VSIFLKETFAKWLGAVLQEQLQGIRSYFSERKIGTDPFNEIGCLVLPVL